MAQQALATGKQDYCEDFRYPVAVGLKPSARSTKAAKAASGRPLQRPSFPRAEGFSPTAIRYQDVTNPGRAREEHDDHTAYRLS